MGTRNRGLPAAIDWAAWAGEGAPGKSSSLKRGMLMTLSLQCVDSPKSAEFTRCMVLYREHFTIKLHFLKNHSLGVCLLHGARTQDMIGIRFRANFANEMWPG